MKTSKTFTLWAALALACTFPGTVRAQIFVAEGGDNTVGNGFIGEYAFDGSPINASLISGLSDPFDLTISGGDIFVDNYRNGTVGEYTIAGAPVNASLISGLNAPWGLAVIPDLVNSGDSDVFVVNNAGYVDEYTVSGGAVIASHPSLISGLNEPTGIAISGGDIFVAEQGSASIAEYTLSGGPVNTSLISSLYDPMNLAITSDIFIANYGSGNIGEYTTSGAPVNTSLIYYGSDNPEGLAITGGDVFVTGNASGTVGEYTTSGGTITSSLILGLSNPTGIAVLGTPAPEPSTDDLTALSITALFGLRRRK